MVLLHQPNRSHRSHKSLGIGGIEHPFFIRFISGARMINDGSNRLIVVVNSTSNKSGCRRFNLITFASIEPCTADLLD